MRWAWLGRAVAGVLLLGFVAWPDRVRAATAEGAPPATVVAPLRPGQAAPRFVVAGGDGQEVSLARFQGQVVYLAFWASWCPACQQSMIWLDGLQQKYAAQGLQVIAIGLDLRRHDADLFLGQTPAHFVLGFDATQQVARQYDVRSMPTGVLIDRKGQVRAIYEDFRPSDAARLERAVLAALQAR